MTLEKQRIAIAKACGWVRRFSTQNGRNTWYSPIMKNGAQKVSHKIDILPDYLNDLNAMHEAEKVLTEPQRLAYVRELVLICEPHLRGVIFGLDAGRGWWLTHATAAQRAEAFLRTLSLWEDDK